MYPDQRVEKFVSDNFIPIKIHIKEHPEVFERFGAQWTPTIQILDSEGTKRHQYEGFLPADDFLGQLKLGLAHIAFSHKQWGEAEKLFRAVANELPESDAAPEALYWAGVAKYKQSGDAAALGETAQQFRRRYSNSAWAKKASVWAA